MTWLVDVGRTIVGAVALGAFAILYGLLIKGIDRKLFAWMQERVGPPVRQPFYDVSKLLWKESVVPRHALRLLFNACPIISFAVAITMLLVIPIGPFGPVLEGHGDLILIIYLLTIMGVCLVVGAYSAGSPYAAVGAQRLMVLMMGYELPVSIVILSLAWKYSELYPGLPSFSLSTFVQHPIWGSLGPVGLVGAVLLLLASMTIGIGQLIVPPFDISVADAEIASGATAEYSGRNLAMLYLCDAVKLVALGSLIIALFFPYGLSPLIPGIPTVLAYVVDFLFYMAKLLVVLFLMVTLVRVSLGRFTVDQVVRVMWGHVSLLALGGLVFLALEGVI